jgi:hypothetical protein
MANLTKYTAPPTSDLDANGAITAKQHNTIIDRIGGETSLTGSRVLTTDANGDMAVSTVTTTTLSYLDATSSLQTQINSKSATGHLHVKADISDFSHTHPQSDITNLTTDLSNKSAVGHTHSASDITGTAVLTNDSRLSDARTPLSHTHPISDVTSLQTSLDGKEPSLPTKTGQSLKYLRVNAGETALEWNTVSGAGEANTQTNQGTGEGTLAKTKVGVDLPIKSLKQGTNITLTNNADDVTITAAGYTHPNHSGDVTSVGDGAQTIGNNIVTYAKIQDISATARLIGRITTGAGDPEELTGAQVTTLLDIFTSALKGLVPLSGGGTTNFLRADGTWAVPAGGSGASLNRISGDSGAAGADLTWQHKTVTQAHTSTTPDVDLTTTGVGVGTWHFKYVIIFQSAATTTGVKIAVNHTGTTGTFVMTGRFPSTGGAAATGVHDQVANSATAGLMEVFAERVKNTSSRATVGVDVANSNGMIVVEGTIIVTVSGSLELKIGTEVASSAITTQIGTFLELHKIV